MGIITLFGVFLNALNASDSSLSGAFVVMASKTAVERLSSTRKIAERMSAYDCRTDPTRFQIEISRPLAKGGFVLQLTKCDGDGQRLLSVNDLRKGMKKVRRNVPLSR